MRNWHGFCPLFSGRRGVRFGTKLRLRPVFILAAFAAAFSSLAASDVRVVEPAVGYNCWPMIQSLGTNLVCVYTMGARHDPGEKGRGTYARVSSDGGRTWGERITVLQEEGSGITPIAKGLDANGRLLVWVRRYGKGPFMSLYRSSDGLAWELVAAPKLTPGPMMQITDVFQVPNVGLMSFWFGGSYGNDMKPRRWGVMTSGDNGATWVQRTCGEGMARADWPTEPSGVWLGDGRILALARTESGAPLFQLTSSDSGRTWKVEKTNISDTRASTPTLLYDRKSDVVTAYYYHRGAGVLRRRTARAKDVFSNPKAWPDSVALASDGGHSIDAGNANATDGKAGRFVAYYTGKAPNCAVVVLPD